MAISKAIGRTILYAASTFYMKGISLFMVPLVVQFLQTEEYGRLEYIGSFAILLSVIVGFGLEDTLYRYCSRQKSTSDSRNTAAHIYGLVLLIGTIFLTSTVALLIAFGSTTSTYVTPYLCFILILTLSLEGIIAIPLGWMRMRDHFKLYCLINVSRASTQAALTILFLYFGQGVEGVFEAGLVSTTLTACVCFIYQKRSTGLLLNLRKSFTFIKYSLPIVASGFLAFALNGFDKWVLEEFTSLSDLAFYAVAGKFAIALTIAMQPYGMWWSPNRFSLLNKSDGHHKASRYAIWGLLQVALFSLAIGLLAPVIIISLFSSEFHSCITLIAPLLAVFAVKESAEFLTIGCFTKDSTATQMRVTLVSTVVGVSLMLLATPAFGLLGLILSLLVAQSTRTILLFIYAQREVRLKIPYNRLLLLLTATFISITAANLHLTQELQNVSLFDVLLKNIGVWLTCIALFSFTCLSLFKDQLSTTPVAALIQSITDLSRRHLSKRTL